MSNFKFNTTVDITEHARVMVSDRTDMDTACSFLLSDTGFTDEQNPNLRVLSGGTFKTANNETYSTMTVPSTYLVTDDLKTQYDGKKDWPVAVLPLRDGEITTWREARSNVIQWALAANTVAEISWNSNRDVSLYVAGDLVFTLKNNPQVMLDIQAPGGKGGNGYGWRSSVYDYRGYSGGGGGGGGFATILFTADCGGVSIRQDASNNIIVSTGSSGEHSIGTIYKGGDASGNTAGAGGTVSLSGRTGVYVINKVSGGKGGSGYTEATWYSDREVNDQFGSTGYEAGSEMGLSKTNISLSPRIVNNSSYMKFPGSHGAHETTYHYGSYNLYPGGGGGGSALGVGGKGQRSESGSAATAGTYGAGGGGGGTKVNDCNATPANGGPSRIIMYVINQ